MPIGKLVEIDVFMLIQVVLIDVQDLVDLTKSRWMHVVEGLLKFDFVDLGLGGLFACFAVQLQ